MWHSIKKGPYVRPMILDPDDTKEQIIEPLSKMIEINKKKYIANNGRVDIQTKNTRYGGNSNRNAGRQNKNQAFNAGNGNDESQFARDCQQPRVHDAKYFREQMLLAMKNEAGNNLNAEENDFMLDNSFRDETLKELIVAVIMMARIQPADDNDVTKPNYVSKAISKRTASNRESITSLLEEHLPRARKPVKKILRMNLSVHRCSIHTVIIDPNGIRGVDESFPPSPIYNRPFVQHVETFIPAATPKPASPKPTSNAVLTQSKLVPITVVRPVTTTVPSIK
nr:hypothetical protein [Tanacetum cinerariifolium]